MPKTDNYGEKLWGWLKQWGFVRSGVPEDPFALYEADQERDYVSFFFVDRPYLHNIAGDPRHPKPAFLMARRGEGKTATREMTAYECIHGRLRGRALAVRYYDFGQVLEQVNGDVERVTARHHMAMISRLTLKALADDVSPTYFDLLGEMDKQILLGYAEEYADPLTQVKLRQILKYEPINLNSTALSVPEMLQTLAGIIIKMGRSTSDRYQALYILVDRVDETSCGLDGAVALLRPLVSEGPVLEALNIAFKFFLPLDVGQRIEPIIPIHRDRLCIEKISWDRESLTNMIKQRLAYYSDNKITELGDLCTPAAKAKVMSQFIDYCDGSPRTLLRLCHALIHYHITHSSEQLIDAAEVRNTITEFEQKSQAERVSKAKETKQINAAPASPPEKGVHIDGGGHVWVNGKPLSKTLPPREFALLRALYRQGGSIVSHTDLIESVWSSIDGGDEQGLRKLIDRLRGRINPEGVSEKDYFIKNAKGRGYWLKVE